MSTLTFQAEPLIVPPGTLKVWQGPQARNFRSALAAEFDNVAVTAELTGDARSPLLCDATVLPRHGHDRKIRQYSTESETSYRKRLAKWRQIWASAGRAWGILRQLRIFLEPYGRPLIRYVSTSGDNAQTQWFELQPGTGDDDYFEIDGVDADFSRELVTPANWIWDASTGKWSRFWVIIYLASGANPAVIPGEWDGTSEWDGTNVWDCPLSAAEVADIVALINDWKAANSMLYGVFFAPSSLVFSPFAVASTVAPWGYSTMPDGNYHDLTKRRPDACYAYSR
jgi:hypothetical protein